MNPTVSQFKEEGHGTLNFPCGLYEVFEDNVWEGVKHHWHEEIEILYFMEGNFTLSINMENFSFL